MVDRHRRRRRRRATVGAALAVFALLVVGGGLFRVAAFSRDTFRPGDAPPAGQQPEPTGTAGAEEVPPTVVPLGYGDTPLIARLRAGRRLTVLLLGYGGAGHDGAYLTDSLEVVSADPASGTLTFISIPRDLWVSIPAVAGQGAHWGKLNEAYAVGVGADAPRAGADGYGRHAAGGALASKVVAQVLGLPIDYWVSMDFVGFKQFIDALGGVDVDVAQPFTDDHYPNNDDANLDPSYRTIHFDAGVQRMDGATALTFARSRYAPEDGSDFGRARRQQLLLAGVARQLFSVEALPKAFGLLDALQGHMHTSFALGEVRDLAGWAQERAAAGQRPSFRGGLVATTTLLVEDTSPTGQSILRPADGQGRYAAIQRHVQRLLSPTPEASVAP